MVRPRARWLLAAAMLAGPLGLLAAPVPAHAATVSKAGAFADGCGGSAQSSDSKGKQVDSVAAPGPPGSSRDNPFLVDYDGTVHYDGSTDSVIKNHGWHVKVFGITVKSGGSKNTQGETHSADTVKVKDYLPTKIPGLFFVSFSLSGTGGSCSANAWVKTAGSPAGSVPFYVGIILVVAGVAIFWFAIPTAVAAGVAGGGMGASVGVGGSIGEPLGGPPPSSGVQ